MAESYELVILDCDGVLVDSEVISTQTLLAMLIEQGLDIDIAHVRRSYLGRSFSTVHADFHRLTGRRLPEVFEADFVSRLFAAYRLDLRATEGVQDLIGALAGRYCMATSSSIERATLSLEVTGLLPLFQGRIFSASMVANGKPAPDLFLHAARTLGADPANCLVIEDSEVGILAAQNAGMQVWRFIGGGHFDDDERAALTSATGVRCFRSMNEMAAILRGV